MVLGICVKFITMKSPPLGGEVGLASESYSQEIGSVEPLISAASQKAYSVQVRS